MIDVEQLTVSIDNKANTDIRLNTWPYMLDVEQLTVSIDNKANTDMSKGVKWDSGVPFCPILPRVCTISPHMYSPLK